MGDSISTRAAYGKALAELCADENIYVFDADLKKCTMTQYFAEKYPDRFYNVGIAEANMVGIAAGFATCGATSFVNTFAIFATGLFVLIMSSYYDFYQSLFRYYYTFVI